MKSYKLYYKVTSRFRKRKRAEDFSKVKYANEQLQPFLDLLNEDTKSIVSGKLMTGQEWYENWINETAGQLFPYRTPKEQELVFTVCAFFNQAAKRASNLEDKA